MEVLASAIGKVKTKIINLDFGQVEFVSRSVAHALMVLKEDLSRRLLRKKQIHFINASNDVETMFRAVAANRAIPKPKPTFNLEIVSINALV